MPLLGSPVHAKIFQAIDFFKFLQQSDNELLVSECKKIFVRSKDA